MHAVGARSGACAVFQKPHQTWLSRSLQLRSGEKLAAVIRPAPASALLSNIATARLARHVQDKFGLKAALHKPVALLWMTVTLGFPSILVYSAVRTYRALDDQKAVYLRSRVAAIASRLETIAPEHVKPALEEETGLLDVVIFDAPRDAVADPMAALWLGRELFRTERVLVESQPAFRAHVPFHGSGGLRLARIDLAESSADFLVEHARHHLWIVAAGAFLFVALSLLTAWSVRRLIRAEHRQLELEHLAHIGKMSAVLAHEIRNPLGTIKGFAQLLAEQAPQHDTYLTPIVSETVRLEGLVKDLLLYGRPSQPSSRPTRARELAATLEAHVSQMQPALQFQSQVEDVTFPTDPNLLEQAMLNLLKNAVEALHDQPDARVSLEMNQTAREVVWRVVDNGPGLTAEARRRLFEPFYTSKASGTGLGLSITRKLAQSLGGTCLLENRPTGGTVAEIRLPAQ